MDRIVLEQVGQHVVVREIVHGDEVDVGGARLLRRTEHVPTDAAKTIDGYADGHPLASH